MTNTTDTASAREALLNDADNRGILLRAAEQEDFNAAIHRRAIRDGLSDDTSVADWCEKKARAFRAVAATLTPPVETSDTAAIKRARELVAKVADGQFDDIEAVADQWIVSAGVQRMANAIASVFEKHASQEIMDRFRQKLSDLMHLAFTEGAAQGIMQAACALPTATPETPEPVDLGADAEREAAFIWRWIERAAYDDAILSDEAIDVLVGYPGAPWKNGRWDVDHKPYAAAFYKRHPRAAVATQPSDSDGERT